MIDEMLPLPGVHRGLRAVQRLVEYAPSTGGLALWVAHRDLPEPRQPAGAGAAEGAAAASLATDGRTLHYAAAFEALPLAEQTALVARGVLHVALRHAQRLTDLEALAGDVDRRLFDLCAGAVIHSALAHLSWMQLPRSAVRLEQLVAGALGVQQTAEQALLAWDVESLYRAIDDRTPPEASRRAGDAQGQGRGGQPRAQERADADPRARRDGPRAAAARALVAPGALILQPARETQGPPEAEAQAAREWRERLVRAHAGDAEFSLLRTLLADLPRSRTPWEQVLRTALARALAERRALSWSRPSRSYLANRGRIGARRLPFEPGTTSSDRRPVLALIVDVSGSIEDGLLRRFAREINALLRRHGAGLVLVIGDDRVRHEQVLSAAAVAAAAARGGFDAATIEFQGGGGTDFAPLLRAADAHRPDLGIVLTDLQGPADFRPRWPVWWAVPQAHENAREPFGRKLVLR